MKNILIVLLILLGLPTYGQKQVIDLTDRETVYSSPFDRSVAYVQKHSLIKTAAYSLPDSTVIVTKGFYNELDGGESSFVITHTIPSGLVVDNISVIDLDNSSRYAVMFSTNESVSLDAFGLLKGNIATLYPALTSTQLDSVWADNFNRLKLATKYSIKIGKRLHIPIGTYEIKLDNTGIGGFADDEYFEMSGSGREKSIFDIKPEWNDGTGATAEVYFLKLASQGTMKISEFTIKGTQYDNQYEAYLATLKTGGVSTVTTIVDTLVREAFWREVNGKRVYLQSGGTNAYVVATVISSDSIAKTITTDVGYTGTSDLTGSSVFAFFHWDDNANPDTIATYSRIFISEGGVINGTMRSVAFYINPSQGNYDIPGKILIDNIYMDSLTSFVTKFGGGANLIISNCYINASGVGVGNFHGNFPNDAGLFLQNTEFRNCATIASGYGAIEDGVYGHDVYVSPNTELHVDNCKFIGGKGAKFSYYTGGGATAMSRRKRSTIKSSYFDNVGQGILLSETIHCVFDGCVIESSIRYGLGVSLINCRFSGLTYYSFTAPSITDTTSIEIKIQNSSLSGSGISVGGGTSNAEKTRLYVDGLDAIVRSDGFNLFTVASNVNRVVIKNVTIKNPYNYRWSLCSVADNNYVYVESLKADDVTTAGASTLIAQAGAGTTIEINNSSISNMKMGAPDIREWIQNRVVIRNSFLELNDGVYLNSSSFTYMGPKDLPKKPYFITSRTLTLDATTKNILVASSSDTLKSIIFSKIPIKNCNDTELVITPIDSVYLIGYDDDTTSNLNVISGWVKTPFMVKYKFGPVGTNPYVVNRFITVGTGAATSFENTGIWSYNSFSVIPGTVKVRNAGIASTVGGIDDYVEGLYGDSVSGYYSYLNPYYKLEFVNAPGSGDSIYVEYQRYTTQHHYGLWQVSYTGPELKGSGELATYFTAVPPDTLSLITSYTTYTVWQVSDVDGTVTLSTGGDSLILERGTYEISYSIQWLSQDAGGVYSEYVISAIREGAGVVSKSLRKTYKASNTSSVTHHNACTYRTEITSDGTPISLVLAGDDGVGGGDQILVEKAILYVVRIK